MSIIINATNKTDILFASAYYIGDAYIVDYSIGGHAHTVLCTGNQHSNQQTRDKLRIAHEAAIADARRRYPRCNIDAIVTDNAEDDDDRQSYVMADPDDKERSITVVQKQMLVDFGHAFPSSGMKELIDSNCKGLRSHHALAQVLAKTPMPATANILFASVGAAAHLRCNPDVKDIAYVADCVINGKRYIIKNAVKSDKRDYEVRTSDCREKNDTHSCGSRESCADCSDEGCEYYHCYRDKMTFDEYLEHLADLRYVKQLERNNGVEPKRYADTLDKVIALEIIADMRNHGIDVDAAYIDFTIDCNDDDGYNSRGRGITFEQRPRKEDHFTDHARARIASEVFDHMPLEDGGKLLEKAFPGIYSASEIEELR